ncbi:substrate-binding domain-containing protein [Sorangium sp. So ce1389]|uniref:substrate-binding domain-containing protein n=1 Tax=Sorangium sp. So ce1389 TaxID=3133336 RepID=UPI003F63652D
MILRFNLGGGLMEHRSFSGGVLLATTMLACSEGSGMANDPVSIAYITYAECSRFCDICRAGAAQAEADLSASVAADGKTVDVMILEPRCTDQGTPVTANPEDPCAASRPQMARLQEAIDMKVDAIVIDIQQAECETPLIDQAVDAGVKVVTYGGDAPQSKRHTYYGIDDREAGAFLMDALAAINGETGKIALQTEFKPDGEGGFIIGNSVSFVNRVAGFEEALKKYPNMENVAIVPCAGVDDADPACTVEAEKALNENPDIVGFAFARSKIFSEVDIAENAPLLTERAEAGDIHSVAFDAQPSYFEDMRAGYVDVLVGQKLFGWGFDTVTLAYDLATQEDVRVSPFTNAGWYTICPNNLDEFEAMNQAQDYRTPLSKCDLLP